MSTFNLFALDVSDVFAISMLPRPIHLRAPLPVSLRFQDMFPTIGHLAARLHFRLEMRLLPHIAE